ncbi:hypothetical protein BFJ69_g5897 [Fusarium oxysporum]|uniref:Uncharacterized protein n=1 Tax=Fusarium oxysporum TaxID=5507 RepID=A0A420NC91_FUSOX|nr:hypothetical protein BFJ69_g5897 [Fusarium oxysporum]
MTPNNNDKDTPMEHGELPNTTENAQGRPVSDNAVPSPTTAAVRPAFGTAHLSNVNAGQNMNPMRGSTFHGAMGFSRGLGHGGRGNPGSGGPGRVASSVRGRGGRGNSGPGRGNFGHGRGRGQSNHGRGYAHSSRGGIQKHPTRVLPADANKSTDKPDNEVVPSTSESTGSQATTKKIPMTCILTMDEEGMKRYREMQEYAHANNLLFTSRPMHDNATEIIRRRHLLRKIDCDERPPFNPGAGRGLGDRKEKEQKPPVEPSDEPGMECIICPSKTHNTEYCLNMPSGDVRLCILCPSKRHHTKDCAKMADMGLTEKVRVFVDRRANLPPLYAEVPWWDLLYTWLNDDSSKGQALPTGFPWSREFTEEIARRQRGRYVRGLQVEFDGSGHDREVLPKDVTTLTLDAVYINHVAKDGTTWVTDLAKRVLGEGGHNSST